jgi:hypothetical protein
MDRKSSKRMSVVALGLLVLIAGLWIGCSSGVKEKRSDSAAGEVKEVSRPEGKYYFGDVLVPLDMNYKPKKSFIYETPGVKAGILVFTKWWLDPNSVVDFFLYNMEKDNWKTVNAFRGKEAILNFTKAERSCTIRIKEHWQGTTEVEIRVGPAGEKKM